MCIYSTGVVIVTVSGAKEVDISQMEQVVIHVITASFTTVLLNVHDHVPLYNNI